MMYPFQEITFNDNYVVTSYYVLVHGCISPYSENRAFDLSFGKTNPILCWNLFGIEKRG
jgi:hypothetical protein